MNDYKTIIDEIRLEASEHLTAKRYRHTESVLEKSLELARKYNLEPNKITIAALAHDMFKGINDDELNKLIVRYDVDPEYLNNNNLAHGPVAAGYIEDKYGVGDEDILNAIRYHTTGRYGMGLYEKVIFLADAIEQYRDYPGVGHIRKMSEESLDLGVKEYLHHLIEYLNKEKIKIDKNTIDAFSYII
jgi:predicted HD superfamily hydrolase involved in NAD metabolism